MTDPSLHLTGLGTATVNKVLPTAIIEGIGCGRLWVSAVLLIGSQMMAVKQQLGSI